MFCRDVKKISFSSDFGPGIAYLQKSTDKVKFVPVFWIPDNWFSTVFHYCVRENIIKISVATPEKEKEIPFLQRKVS